MKEGDEQERRKKKHGIAVKIRNKLKTEIKITSEREAKRTTEEPSVLEMAYRPYAALQGILLQVAAEKKVKSSKYLYKKLYGSIVHA